MRLFGIKSCDTCRKALKELPNAEFVCVRERGIDDELLGRAIAQFGEALINKRSTTWRQLDESLREAEPAWLLKEHPTLMKRPLIEQEGQLWLGWTAQTRAGLGLG